jgi:hypothetical protein
MNLSLSQATAPWQSPVVDAADDTTALLRAIMQASLTNALARASDSALVRS